MTPPSSDPFAARFARLFEAHFEELARYAYGYLHSVDEARDAVHDVFLRLWRRRREIELRPDSRAYLYTMTRHHALDLLRRRDREDRRRREYSTLATAGVEGSVSSNDRAIAVRAAIAALPRRQREVVELRWLQQMSYDEIGQVLGISPNTAGVHMHRAISTLRERLVGKDPLVL